MVRCRVWFVGVAIVALASATVPADATFLNASILRTTNGASDATDYCRQELETASPCAPYEFIEIVITGDPLPQLMYRSRIRVPGDTGDPTDGPRVDLLPLGYISTSTGPIPTGTAPRTHWLRRIENLSGEAQVITYCTNYFTQPTCGTNSAHFAYTLGPDQTITLPNPFATTTRNPGAFPQPPTKFENSYYLTSRTTPLLRGLIHMQMDRS